MRFHETALAGAWIIEPEQKEDRRGWFARIRCEKEFGARGLEARFVQTSEAHNTTRGTVRGMHFQVAPAAEVKLVRCVLGSALDVIIDLRPESPTFSRHFAQELSAANGIVLYVPQGFAHGYQTLEDQTRLAYEISDFHSPDHARGVRWNDVAFGISWPLENPIIHERDASYPDFDPRMLT